jgi:hypothetical protein
MAETIQCVHCSAPLRLPEQFIGQEVRCPSCQKTFTAQMPAAPPPPPRPEPEEERRDEPPPQRDVRPSRRRASGDDDDDYPRSRRPRYDDDYGRGSRLEPHRGSTILTLGIMTIVFAFCCLPLALGMGIPALVMGSSDLGRIQSGDMDPSGQGQINAGRTCAIIGMVLSVGLTFLGCLINVAGGRHH